METGVVDRENVEFAVSGDVPSGWVSLGLASEEAVMYGFGLVLFALAIFVIRSFIGGSRPCSFLLGYAVCWFQDCQSLTFPRDVLGILM